MRTPGAQRETNGDAGIGRGYVVPVEHQLGMGTQLLIRVV